MNPQSKAPSSPIRVLLVDDSPLALVILKKILASSPGMEVVGTARDGKEALDLIPKLQPTIVCTDYQMPVMNGLELTKEVMAKYPRPVLIVSAVVNPSDAREVFPIMEAGALDVIAKPQGMDLNQPSVKEFISKVRLLSGVFVFARRQPARPQLLAPRTTHHAPRTTHVRIVAIGASTGGPQTLQIILPQLPSDFPVPVLCVQHISEGFLQGFVEWLGGQCKMKVKVAQPGETPLAGTIYFPEERTHLKLDDAGRLMSSHEPPVSGHRPSATVTFQSVARHFGSAAVGVLLTGIGSDGAEGMKAIAQAGGVTIAQDEESCVVFGMPKQAIALGAAQHILPPSAIGQTLTKLVRR
jgi:two-component system chemotaxis response regulator CheB